MEKNNNDVVEKKMDLGLDEETFNQILHLLLLTT